MLRDGLQTQTQSVSRTELLNLLGAATGLWSCGKRGPSPVSHSLHSLDDDDPTIIITNRIPEDTRR